MIVYELLSDNLRDVAADQILPSTIIHAITIQLLNALIVLNKHQVIHCDLKPENILLIEKGRTGIKLIDLSLSCFINNQIYSYIQSRFILQSLKLFRNYRAPEIILGLPYDTSIDIWSLGCIIAELALGYPLFDQSDESQMINNIINIIGRPTQDYIDSCPYKDKYFNEDGTEKELIQIDGKKSRVLDRKIKNKALRDFIQQCLVWESYQRMTPLEALQHQWILESKHFSFFILIMVQLYLRKKKKFIFNMFMKKKIKIQNSKGMEQLIQLVDQSYTFSQNKSLYEAQKLKEKNRKQYKEQKQNKNFGFFNLGLKI